MTKERKTALWILSHNIDNMSYWQESYENGRFRFDDGIEVDISKVNDEVNKIMKQIIDRYDLNRI